MSRDGAGHRPARRLDALAAGKAGMFLQQLGRLPATTVVGISLLAAVVPWAAGHWLLLRPLRIDLVTLQAARDELANRQAGLSERAARLDGQVRELGRLEKTIATAMEGTAQPTGAEDMTRRVSQLASAGGLAIHRLHIQAAAATPAAGRPVLQVQVGGSFAALADFVRALAAMAVPERVGIERLEVQRAPGQGKSAAPLLGLEVTVRMVSEDVADPPEAGALDKEQTP